MLTGRLTEGRNDPLSCIYMAGEAAELRDGAMRRAKDDQARAKDLSCPPHDSSPHGFSEANRLAHQPELLRLWSFFMPVACPHSRC
jgi:hypothetical protein